jgi:hypothetical protein
LRFEGLRSGNEAADAAAITAIRNAEVWHQIAYATLARQL